MRTFNLSANIENGFAEGTQYIVTSNARKAIHNIVNGFHSGIHSFTIIGTYGTGKSSFLLALESDLQKKRSEKYLIDNSNLSANARDYEFLNILGDYTEFSKLLSRKLNVEGSGNSIFDDLKSYYNSLQQQGKFLVIVVDEFGKVLEHAAKNNPEKELYFMQKLAEFVNVPSRNILLLTTLHQNFSSYAKGLTEEQYNEWTKVKGRFKEITFVEPIEQLLQLASEQLHEERDSVAPDMVNKIFHLAKSTRFIADDFSEDVAQKLFPLDTFSAYAITTAIQRYGQNERSLFTFLSSKGENSISEFEECKYLTYNLQNVYDYILYNFYSYLKEANADSMNWSSIQVSIERVEGQDWESKEQMLSAVKIVKAIGLLNLFGKAGFRLTENDMAEYAILAMHIQGSSNIIERLKTKKIIRYAAYKERLMLFEGTDVDLEAEIRDAGMMVPRPVAFVDDLRLFFNKRISPVKAHYYQKGTPRFFDYRIEEEPLDIIPFGDTDGYIELIFSTSKNALNEIKTKSEESNNALIFAYFKNTEDVVDNLYNINKYRYLLERVINKEDRVAVQEIQNLKEYEETLLNRTISDNLFGYGNRVIWIYDGKERKVQSHRDFNKFLSQVCDEVYCKTPVMNNELFNKHKISGAISTARKNYLNALIEHGNEEDLGFPEEKFPPEKTIYYSLLKNTELHCNGTFMDIPNNEGIMPLWDACEDFLNSTESKARKISELIKLLSDQPYKIKQGFLDFWIPTYLYIRRQDFALYDAPRGAYMPEINMEFFDLLQKHPADFEIKKFAIDGVKMGFFNQYRRFVNLEDEFVITNESFIETIKPFLSFYVRLNEYTKHTRKFDHESTMRFRDVLATAKDPEKTFFEDLPEALGFDQDKLKKKEFVDQYGLIIQHAIRELRTCYPHLIDRLEERLVDGLGLESGEYDEYVQEIRKRLANVKVYLLTDKQREFYHHAMTEYDNRTQWYQSICYPIMESRLDALRDEQEDKVADDLVFLFRECEKYSSISEYISEKDKSEAYSFDLATNQGVNLRTQTYILHEKDKRRSTELEKQIEMLLSGDNNMDVCTLLSLLNKKINK